MQNAGCPPLLEPFARPVAARSPGRARRDSVSEVYLIERAHVPDLGLHNAPVSTEKLVQNRPRARRTRVISPSL